jgi:hypothetical protein
MGPLFDPSGAGGAATTATGASATTTSATATGATTNGSTTGGGANPSGTGGAATVGAGGSAGPGTGGTSNAGGSGPAGAAGASDASVSVDATGSGGATGDASTSRDAVAIDARPMTCDAGVFPTFDSGCTDTINCSFGLHQIDCCGTLVAIGFNHAFRDAFDKAEANWRMACPAACGCMAGPTRAEDGKVGSSQNVMVTCETRGPGSGRCTTFFP